MSRNRLFAIASTLILSALLHAPAARAHDDAAAASGGVKAEMAMWITDAEDKLIQLAEATPEANYAWRPSKDVRSAGDVFMHVVSANYGVPSFWGVKPPEGFNFATHETSLTKKADIVTALKGSFAHVKGALASATDADLDKPAEFFGMKTTVRGGYMLLLSHAHEHLGQSIAYARSNGIVPPWTAKREAAAKGKEKAAETK